MTSGGGGVAIAILNGFKKAILPDFRTGIIET